MTEPCTAAAEPEAAAPAAPPQQIETTHDGWIYDLATGEVIGRTDEFAIDSPEAADRALEIRAAIEADIVAIDARIKALTSNLQALRRERERRLGWWEFKYYSQLIGFARTQLKGKARTARFAFGAVSFRAVPPSTSIIDDQAAMEFVETWAPEAITVKRSVNRKAVDLAITRARATIGDEPLPFLATSQPSESIAIKTGIGASDQ